MNRREFLKSSSRALAAASVVGAFDAAALAQPDATPPTSRPGDAMLKRVIPSSGESIPVIGMGTWQTFNVRDMDRPEQLTPLEEVLRIFFDAGGRVIDSSPMYGSSEDVVGLLSERAKINGELFIATKVWTTGKDAGAKQMEASMAKLRRSKLELMQVHNLVDWQNQLATLRDWKQQGRFRYIGVTHFSPAKFDDLEQIIRRERIDFVQLPYSVAMRQAEPRLIPAAKDSGVAILVMRPFEGGNLFAKTKDLPLPDGVKAYASSWSQAFLKFLLANDAITCVIPATSKPRHMSDNVQAGLGALPDEAQRRELVRLLGV